MHTFDSQNNLFRIAIIVPLVYSFFHFSRNSASQILPQNSAQYYYHLPASGQQPLTLIFTPNQSYNSNETRAQQNHAIDISQRHMPQENSIRTPSPCSHINPWYTFASGMLVGYLLAKHYQKIPRVLSLVYGIGYQLGSQSYALIRDFCSIIV